MKSKISSEGSVTKSLDGSIALRLDGSASLGAWATKGWGLLR